MDKSEDASDFSAVQAEAIERFQELHKQTKNPMYVWQAILSAAWRRERGASYKPSTEPLSLPSWCADYLKEVAWDLSCLSGGMDLAREGVAGEDYPRLSMEAATKLVPQALGLTRQGYSAFEQFQATTELMQFFRRYEDMREKGATSAEAIERLIEEGGFAEERTVRRRIAAGRRHAKGDRPEDKLPTDKS